MERFLKFFSMIVLVAAASLANALVFNVTSPASGTVTDPTFLGSTNTISFSATSVDREITVTVAATNLDTSTVITREQKFTPSDSKVDSSIALNFAPGTPEGNYQIVVSCQYTGDASSLQTVTLTNLKLDITKPKLLEFNPGNNSFVGAGIVHITAHVQEANFKNYTVQVNSQDIPNNTGTTLTGSGDLLVDWDTTGIVTDGKQSITINIKDKAGNESTQTMSVTLDRVKPSLTIKAPGKSVAARSTWVVIADLLDASTDSSTVGGIDVILTRTDGSFLYRVPRVSFNSQGSQTNRWTGRVQGNKITLPKQIILKITAVDRAGNIAVVQSTTITVK